MMEPILEKGFTVRSYEVDPQGRVRVTAILNYLQEVAGDHARLLGVAVRDLLPQGLTWVISRMHLKLFSEVSSREELHLRTWPATRDARFTCREFELSAANGRLLGAATASFAVLDIATRRPVETSRLPAYPLAARRAIADDFATIPRLSEPESELTFRVGREELDINNHLNNVVYAGWALETVPKAMADQSRLADLEIAFRAEAFYGETVVARSAVMANAGHDVYLHQIVRAADGLELARLISRWQPDTGH